MRRGAIFSGFWARGTLTVTGVLVLVLNTGVIDAEATGVAGEPLLDGFRAIVDGPAAVLALFTLVGLLASLHDERPRPPAAQ